MLYGVAELLGRPTLAIGFNWPGAAATGQRGPPIAWSLRIMDNYPYTLL